MATAQSRLGDRILDLDSNNYLPWRVRIDKILDSLDFPGGHASEPAETSTCHHEWKELSANAAIFIRQFVSSPLRSEIPADAWSSHLKALEEIKRLAFSFRFLDLPHELRTIVYEMIIKERCWVSFRTFDKPRAYQQSHKHSRFPAITAVSQQIRSETMPLVYAVRRFSLDLGTGKPPNHCRLRGVQHGVIARSWANALGSANLKHLRRLDLGLHLKTKRGHCSMAVLTLTFDERRGLDVGIRYCENGISKESMDVLEKYIAEVEAMRKMLGLQGEALVMAVTGRDEIWRYGTLKGN